MIYFLRHGEDGPIKIGCTSRSVWARVDEIQTPEELTVMGVVPGGSDAALHRRFAHLRIRGEWFTPAPDLLSFIRDTSEVPRPRSPRPFSKGRVNMNMVVGTRLTADLTSRLNAYIDAHIMEEMTPARVIRPEL